MPADLRDLLEDAARRPQSPLDVGDIRRRARRSRTMEVAGIGVAVLLLVAGVLLALDAYPRPNSPIIGDGQTANPSTTPSAPVSAAPVTATSDLGVDVIVTSEDSSGAVVVVVHHPDGTTTERSLQTSAPLTIFPDDAGGFTWQSHADGGSPPILHVAADGRATELVPGTVDPSESFLLVGRGEGGALVTHRRGTTPDDMTVDLLRVGYDGVGETIGSGVAGWESSVMTAATLEHAVYTLDAEGFSMVIIDPPDAAPTTVFEGGEGTGTYAVGVDVTAYGQAVALVDDPSVGVEEANAQLLVIDPSSASITATIEVPLRLDTDVPFIRASGVSVEGGFVVVNRYLEGERLRPLVYDLADGTWSVLDVMGPALLARPVSSQPADPACAEDADRVSAPPRGGATLDLYLVCQESAPFWDAVHRLDTDIERTDDIAADAQTILVRLLEGANADQQADGYLGLSEPSTGSVTIREVAFSDGTLTIDFGFPDGGVGNYSTSAGGAMWHLLLTANLLQFDEVERVALLADGDCEAYTAAFEGSGCRVVSQTEAPWAEAG